MSVPKDPEEISLNQLYRYLSKFHLSDSLAMVGRINAAFKYGTRGLFEERIPIDILTWLKSIPQEHYAILYLESTRLVRFLLLSGANDLNKKVLNLQDRTLPHALDLCSRLYDQDAEVPPGSKNYAPITFGRITQWQFPLQTDRETMIGRSYLLFYVLPKEMTLPYSMEEKMKEFFDIGAFEFIATAMALWLQTNGTLDYELTMEIDYLKPIVTPKNILTFRDLHSGEARRYQNILREKTGGRVKMKKMLDIYGLDPFSEMPCIIVNNSTRLPSGTYLVPSAKHLLDTASTGIFHLLANREHKNKQNNFRQMFGSLYREYVGRQLRQAQAPQICLDLDAEFPNPSGKLPDFALINGNACVLFEVKLSLLTLDARTYFHEEDLRAEAQKGNIQKAISQLIEFRQAILDHKIKHPTLAGIEKVMFVIVGFEDIFVANATLLPLLEEIYGADATDFQLACITDIESIGNYLEKNKDAVNMLFDKINDPTVKNYAIFTYIESKIARDNKIVRSAAQTFLHHLVHGI